MQIPDYLETVYNSFKNVKLELIKRSRYRGMSDIAVICVLRDEIHLISEFLDHYRMGGIRNFVFIDNGSEDGTVERLSAEPDVTLYQTRDRFDWRMKQGWINLVMMMQGVPNWFIYADADEKIVFDGYPRRSFADLCFEMERRGIRRVRGFLLDMYGKQPILAAQASEPFTLAEWSPFYDAEGYSEAQFAQIISRKGGPRKRAFGSVDTRFNPELTKYPIFKLRPGEIFVNPHSHWPYDDNFASPCFLGILHYKFTPQFGRKMKRAIEENTYWSDSIEYKCYSSKLSDDEKLSMYSSGCSRRYTRPEDLISSKLIESL